MSGSCPVAVGGVGGSGTRVIAAILQKAQFHIGNDLNEALDNLWFTLLFKYPEAFHETQDIFDKKYNLFLRFMTGGTRPDAEEFQFLTNLATNSREQHDEVWLRERLKTSMLQETGNEPERWGWKEPNTHFFIDKFLTLNTDLKYVHVARNGLDMAFSGNQNQAKLWGELFLGEKYDGTPNYSLKFWKWAHERILDIGTQYSDRFLFLRYEELCKSPQAEIIKLLDFLDLEYTSEFIQECSALVSMPQSVGRYKNAPLDQFDREGIEFVRDLGFIN